MHFLLFEHGQGRGANVNEEVQKVSQSRLLKGVFLFCPNAVRMILISSGLKNEFESW